MTTPSHLDSDPPAETRVCWHAGPMGSCPLGGSGAPCSFLRPYGNGTGPDASVWVRMVDGREETIRRAALRVCGCNPDAPDTAPAKETHERS